MRKVWLGTVAGAAALAAWAGPGLAEPYVRQGGVSVDHYVFKLEVGENSRTIKGEATASVRIAQPGVTDVAFDLAAKDDSGLGMVVGSVVEARTGKALRFTHQGRRLQVSLDQAPPVGERLDLQIAYEGEPRDGLRFGVSDQGQRIVASWNWPVNMRQWAPSLDHPSSKATSEWVVTTPQKWSVAASGLLQGETPVGDGRKTTHWKQGVAIPVWLNAVQIGSMQTRIDTTAPGVPLQIWAPQGRKVDFDNGFLVARRSLSLFSELVGPYPYEKLGQVVAPLGSGAMEHASLIFYGDGGVRDGHGPVRSRPSKAALDSVGAMPHEIAHQWFGNSVTESTWGDVWLSEGFATYFGHLYTERYEGRDAFLRALATSRPAVFEQERTDNMSVVSPMDESEGPNLTRLQYAKGAWVLHMLRSQIGDTAFFKGVKLYYGRHKGGHASTDDFRRAMEDASGQALGDFFDQWLTRVASPRIDVSWRYDARAKMLRLEVAQDGDPYAAPLKIAAQRAGAEPQVLTVQLKGKRHSFNLPLDFKPSAVVLDPEVELLADLKVRASR